MVEIVLMVVGVALIVVVLLDVFHTLMHPRGTGYLSPWVFAGIWRLSRATGHRVGNAVGPAALVAVILLWVLLQGVGWGMLYHPHVPLDFTYSDGIDPDGLPAFVQALYFSFVTLATLGFGDMVPSDSWIRWVTPFQALTGFALLTGALTWFNQVYPPLLRRRELATVTGRVEQVRIDFYQHSEGFYFRERSEDLSLPRQLAGAVRLSEPGPEGSPTGVELSRRQLSVALERLARTLDQQFLHRGGPPEQVFSAYLREHHP